MIQRRIQSLLFVFTISDSILCFNANAQNSTFGNRVNLGLIECNKITEASGIAASRQNPGVLWTHNDSGDKNRLYALNTAGKHLGVYYIAGCTARDWEDLAAGPGPVEGQSYIYIGDIGDNGKQYEYKYIYKPKILLFSRRHPMSRG